MSDTSVVENVNNERVLALFEGVQIPPRLVSGDNEQDTQALLDWTWGFFNAVSEILIELDRRVVIQEALMASMVKHMDDIGALEQLTASAGTADDNIVALGSTWNATQATRANDNFRDLVAKVNALVTAHPTLTVQSEET